MRTCRLSYLRTALFLLASHSVVFFTALSPGYYHQYYLRRRVSDDASGHCPCGHDDADAGAVADDNRFVLGGGDRGRGALRPKDKNNNHIRNDPFDVPTIFVVTPTRPRMTQMVDLTSLCHTLMHVRGLHWLVVEESDTRTSLVSNLLHRCSVSSTHLTTPSPQVDPKAQRRRNKSNNTKLCDQRNHALVYLRAQCGSSTGLHSTPMTFTERTLDQELCKGGIVYFADDSNKYDLRLFGEMRKTKRLSMWPVGYAGERRYEGPVCTWEGRVDHWIGGNNNNNNNKRQFPTDIAGFAVALDLVLDHRDAWFDDSTGNGVNKNENGDDNLSLLSLNLSYDAACVCACASGSTFLVRLGLAQGDVECIGYHHSEVLVWRVKTEDPDLEQENDASSVRLLETR